MAVVNVIYHHFPHYRGPILCELSLCGIHEYKFFGSHSPVFGIEPFNGDENVVIRPLRFSVKGRRWILRGYLPAVFDSHADCLIVIGNPNMAASWIIAVLGRVLGKKVLFWSHGWLKKESFPKRFIKKLYFSLPHAVLVYGERARRIGLSDGFSPDRISVVYNSLDYNKSRQLINRIESKNFAEDLHPSHLFSDKGRPLIICTARLTKLCRFDLLIDAAAVLESVHGISLNILLVGDGPELSSLKQKAAILGARVCFYGACYDEDVLANLIYHADMTVSPGKIGLTAIHSLTYGTPVITHGELDEQMPEVEVVIEGETGLFFERNNAKDLAEKIRDWLGRGKARVEVRKACMEVIREKWNPASQRVHIESAINNLISEK